jgi:predicted transcriptional regulator
MIIIALFTEGNTLRHIQIVTQYLQWGLLNKKHTTKQTNTHARTHTHTNTHTHHTHKRTPIKRRQYI